MTYRKPEVVVLGEAAVVIQGKPLTPAEDPNFANQPTYDLDE